MSLQIQTLHAEHGSMKPRTPGRYFDVSPSINGYNVWNLDSLGSINVGTHGVWQLTPRSAFTVTLKMWGASGNTATPATYLGGGGGFSSGSMFVEPGITYIMVVGQGGVSVTGSIGARVIGGGASGRSQLATTISPCGGGLSGLFSSSYVQQNAIMIAGGGGGGGSVAKSGSGAGGGSSGQGAGGSYGGAGGSQTAGGKGGYSYYNGADTGSALQGGYGYNGPSGEAADGGGGGGYFGGGGGTTAGYYAGGGGSGYIHPTKVLNGTTIAGSYKVQANSTDPLCQGAGAGILGQSTGTDGRIIIS